jgi:hypothetical protein
MASMDWLALGVFGTVSVNQITSRSELPVLSITR